MVYFGLKICQSKAVKYCCSKLDCIPPSTTQYAWTMSLKSVNSKCLQAVAEVVRSIFFAWIYMLHSCLLMVTITIKATKNNAEDFLASF